MIVLNVIFSLAFFTAFSFLAIAGCYGDYVRLRRSCRPFWHFVQNGCLVLFALYVLIALAITVVSVPAFEDVTVVPIGCCVISPLILYVLASYKIGKLPLPRSKPEAYK
jgi:drug/metabolite transporter superfamily protein YnfA